LVGGDTDAFGRGVGGGGVLPVVAAGQRAGALQVRRLHRALAGGVVEQAVQGIDAAAHGFGGRDRHDGAAVGGGDLGADPRAPRVVDADHGGVAIALVEQDAALGGDIAFHPAVP